MASLLLLPTLLIAGAAAAAAAVVPSCASRSFSNNRTFVTCLDLPHLGSSLYYTYKSASGNLSLAFVSKPPVAYGWVSWGINPVAPTMRGTRAIAAYALANGTVSANTYNVSSYEDVPASKIDYPVAGLEGEVGKDGEVTVYAVLTLPPGTKSVNQVWQVGPTSESGALEKHALADDNLNAKGVLNLVDGQSQGDASGDARIRRRNVRFVLLLVVQCLLFALLF